MSTEFEKTNLGDQIPDNDVCVLGTTGEAHARIVEDQLCNGGFVTVERNDDGGGSRIPETNASVVVAERIMGLESAIRGRRIGGDLPDCEDILICLALRDHTDLCSASRIAPSSQKLSLLHIPAENFLAGTDNGPSGARLACSTGLLLFGPDRIRRRRGDKPERIRMLEFAVTMLAHTSDISNNRKPHVQV
jgi:hypothetical protein